MVVQCLGNTCSYTQNQTLDHRKLECFSARMITRKCFTTPNVFVYFVTAFIMKFLPAWLSSLPSQLGDTRKRPGAMIDSNRIEPPHVSVTRKSAAKSGLP